MTVPELQTPSPSTMVYAAMNTPVSTAAAMAGTRRAGGNAANEDQGAEPDGDHHDPHQPDHRQLLADEDRCTIATSQGYVPRASG